MYICEYFSIKELVSKRVYDYYTKVLGYSEEFLWRFFEDCYKKDLDTIRKNWNKVIYINTWCYGGNLCESGLRSNVETIVKSKRNPYLSGHCLAKGFDLHDKAGDNKGLYECVCDLIRQGKLKAFNRVENIVSTPTWCHTDGLGKSRKLEIFSI